MSEPLSAATLTAIEARVEAATDGPWENDGNGISQSWMRPEPWLQVVTQEVNCGTYCQGGSCSGVIRSADADFISHAREDIPLLLAEVHRLRTLIGENRETK